MDYWTEAIKGSAMLETISERMEDVINRGLLAFMECHPSSRAAKGFQNKLPCKMTQVHIS